MATLHSIARLAATLYVLVLSLPCAAESVAPTLDFNEFVLVITWAEDRAQLEEYRREHSHSRSPNQAGRRTSLKGFSVLGRDKNGELICMVYAIKPRRVNDERTTAIGHELLHCALGKYHR